MDRAKPTDVTVTDGVEHPEIEIVGLVVVGRIREVAVVALGRSFDDGRVFQLLGFGQVGQAPHGLHIIGLALTHQQRTLGISLQVVGVLGNAADQDQRAALLVQAVGHHRAEGKAGHGFGLCGERPTVFLEQQLSGVLGNLRAQ